MSQPGLTDAPFAHSAGVHNPRLPFDRLPDPNHDDHPAYGRAFEKPTLALRLKAIKTVAPWLGFVFLKRMLLFDRLPSLPDYGGPMSGGILGRCATAPRYLRLVAREFKQAIFGADGNAVLLNNLAIHRGAVLARSEGVEDD